MIYLSVYIIVQGYIIGEGSKLKLVFLLTALDYSGGPKMMAWLANQFAKSGHAVSIIAVYSSEIGQPLDDSISFYSLGIKKSDSRIKRNTTEMLHVQRAVSALIESIKPDAVIGFLYSVDYFYTLFSCLKKSAAKIILSQRLDPFQEKGVGGFVKKWIISRADGVVFQSTGAQLYYGDGIKRNVIIPNPVTSKTLSFRTGVNKFEERADVIVVPARLNIKQKRQDVLIDAFEYVITKHPEARLVLLGDGPDKAVLEQQIESKKLSSFVAIHPAVPTAEEFVKNCKIVCLPSDFEGMPNSLIESLALGINVISTDFSPGAARDLIQDGVNGFIVPCGDYKAFADKIVWYLDHPAEANEMANNARTISESYSEENIFERWSEFITTICQQH